MQMSSLFVWSLNNNNNLSSTFINICSIRLIAITHALSYNVDVKKWSHKQADDTCFRTFTFIAPTIHVSNIVNHHNMLQTLDGRIYASFFRRISFLGVFLGLLGDQVTSIFRRE